MTAPLGGAPGVNGQSQHDQLRKVARQLEGVFYGQLFQAMRSAVPEGGLTEASSGEKMFTAMLDEKVADLAAGQSQRGLADALYRQLSHHLSPEPAPVASQEVGALRGNDR